MTEQNTAVTTTPETKPAKKGRKPKNTAALPDVPPAPITPGAAPTETPMSKPANVSRRDRTNAGFVLDLCMITGTDPTDIANRPQYMTRPQMEAVAISNREPWYVNMWNKQKTTKHRDKTIAKTHANWFDPAMLTDGKKFSRFGIVCGKPGHVSYATVHAGVMVDPKGPTLPDGTKQYDITQLWDSLDRVIAAYPPGTYAELSQRKPVVADDADAEESDTETNDETAD